MALTKVQGDGSLVWVFISYRFPLNFNSAIDLDSLHNVSIRGGDHVKTALSLFVVGIASAVGQTLLLGFFC